MDIDKYELHRRYGLVAFYLRRALKHLTELTEAEISQSPYFVKYVRPGLITDLEKMAAWCGIVQDDIKGDILKIEEVSDQDFESALAETNERHGEALKKLADK